jgi:Uma2 family endonuclease
MIFSCHMSTAMDNFISRHRLTVDEYYRMTETGVLDRDARVELIEGEIIDMAPIGTAHASIVSKLDRLLNRAIGDQAIVRVQMPIRLGIRSEPEPDLSLLRPLADFYANQHPDAADIFLIIEVSDSSLRYDREIKAPLYAKHKIPELWIFDIQAKSLGVHRSPVAGAYTDVSVVTQVGSIPIISLVGVSLDLSGIF